VRLWLGRHRRLHRRPAPCRYRPVRHPPPPIDTPWRHPCHQFRPSVAVPATHGSPESWSWWEAY
jgi:hypothetical protein